jgi:hypothetical protein
MATSEQQHEHGLSEPALIEPVLTEPGHSEPGHSEPRLSKLGLSEPGRSESGLDHRGERRLSGKESAVWYAVAAVTYIGIGTWQKVLLTWFIGPMWVVATLTFGPRLYDRIRGRLGVAKANP